MTDPQKNKQTVIAYYNMAFNDRKPAEEAQKYGGPHYIQHNPQAADGFEAFVEFVEGFAEQFPQMSLQIKRALAEGDLVVTYSLLKTSPQDRGTAVADISEGSGTPGSSVACKELDGVRQPLERAARIHTEVCKMRGCRPVSEERGRGIRAILRALRGGRAWRTRVSLL